MCRLCHHVHRHVYHYKTPDWRESPSFSILSMFTASSRCQASRSFRTRRYTASSSAIMPSVHVPECGTARSIQQAILSISSCVIFTP